MRLVLLLSALLACAPASPGPPRPALLWVGGDVHLGDSRAPIFGEKIAHLAGGVGVVNLEGPVGAAPAPMAGVAPRLHNAPAAVPALLRAGVRVVGVANNHAQDLGPTGEAATLATLAGAGLLPAGAAGPAQLRIGGVRVAVTAHDLGRGVPAELGADLARARQGADLLLATFHVTGPPSYLPRPELRAAVEVALRAGAAAVAAHGTHSIARVERRGAQVVAWGLGNLRFSCDCTDERDALLLLLWLGRGGLERAAVLPLEAGLLGQPARRAPDPDGLLDLLGSLGSQLRRDGPLGWL